MRILNSGFFLLNALGNFKELYSSGKLFLDILEVFLHRFVHSFLSISTLSDWQESIVAALAEVESLAHYSRNIGFKGSGY